jgi:predicted kinase
MARFERARRIGEAAERCTAPDGTLPRRALGIRGDPREAGHVETKRQQAYVVCGNAGAGKSTFAARLCREKSAALIDIDTVTERLARLVLRGHGLPTDDRDSPAYKALLREPVYEALFDVALDNLPHVPCVIVGPFTRERREASWPARLAARLATEIEIYVVWCGPEQRRQRLEQRGNPRDVGKLVDFERYVAEGEDGAAPPFAHHWVDTTD